MYRLNVMQMHECLRANPTLLCLGNLLKKFKKKKIVNTLC